MTARDRANEGTLRELRRIEQKKLEVKAKLDENTKKISEIRDRITRLRETVENSTGETRQAALRELHESLRILADKSNEGTGLIEERQGYSARKCRSSTATSVRSRSSLKLQRPSLGGHQEGNSGRRPKAPDGRFIDPNTKLPIDGEFHYGHKHGHEQRRLAIEAQKRGMNQAEFDRLGE